MRLAAGCQTRDNGFLSKEQAISKDRAMDERLETLRARLNQLKQQHRDFDAAITSLEMTGTADQLQLRRLKKHRLMLKDQIALIENQMLPDIIA
jgi:hypothetical protein